MKKKNIYSQLRQLHNQGAVTILDEVEGVKVKAKTVKFVKLAKEIAEIYASFPELDRKSPKQVKILLKETAREDSYTGVIPETGSTKWGFGKVNAYFAVVRALQTTGVLDLEKPILWKIYPNPTSEILYLKDLPADDPTQRCPDIALAREKLSWNPAVSLEEGLELMIEDFKSRIK